MKFNWKSFSLMILTSALVGALITGIEKNLGVYGGFPLYQVIGGFLVGFFWPSTLFEDK